MKTAKACMAKECKNRREIGWVKESKNFEKQAYIWSYKDIYRMVILHCHLEYGSGTGYGTGTCSSYTGC
jgi:hypothetical protein